MHIDKDVDWNGTLLKQDYDICNYDWAPLKKNFTRQNVMKHHPVVCQHFYISNMCTISKYGSYKLGVFTTVLLKIQVFGDVMPC